MQSTYTLFRCVINQSISLGTKPPNRAAFLLPISTYKGGYVQVVSWEPLVVFRESRPGKFEHFCVIQARLRCVFCHSVYTIEAHPVIIREDKKPYEYIHSGMAVMKQHRKCESCGVISGLPSENEKRLQKAVEKVISAEWISEKSQLDPPLIFIQQAEKEIKQLLGED